MKTRQPAAIPIGNVTFAWPLISADSRAAAQRITEGLAQFPQ
jgi:hypothetical protein